MKTKTSKLILISIFLITVIPTVYVYSEHAFVEFKAFENAKTETKQIKTFSEGLLFYMIAWGYTITTLLILFVPRYRIPYLVTIVGTVAVVILYYFRIFGIPIPFTEIVITDFSSDHRDAITKICQNILVIPVSMLFLMQLRSEKERLM